MVINSMMASQNIEQMMTICVRFELYLPCMKNKTTRDALSVAIASATTMFIPAKM